MSVRNILVLVSIPALLAACSTTQESPIYQQSTKYKVHSPHQSQGTATTQQATYQAPTYHQPATYTSGSAAPIYHHTASTTGQMVTTQVNHECLDKEGNRKLIGTAVGGAAGAFAGNKIGDTTGTIIGAVAGGALGYGVADVLTDCDPIEVASPVPAPVTYQSSTMPAQYHHTTSNSTHSAPVVHDSAATEQMVNAEATPAPAPTDSAYGDTFGTPGYHAMIANGELDETQTASISVPEVPATPAPFTPQPAPSYPQSSQLSYPQTTAPAPAPRYPGQQYSGAVSTHKVVEGDTVYNLSRRLCVDVEDIRRLNNLNAAFYIRLDDHIKLPASRC